MLSWRAPSCRRDPCPDCGAVSALQPRVPHVASTSRSLVQTSQPAAAVLGERSFFCVCLATSPTMRFLSMSFSFRWEFLQLNRLLSPAPGPAPPGLAGADVRPLSVRGSCSMDIWSSDRVPKSCTTRRTLPTPAQRSRGGVHHSGRCRKGSTRRNPPRPTDNEQPIQHRHTNVHRVHLVNGQPGQQPVRRSTSLQRWEATKDPRIVMHLPVQSDGALDISSVPLHPPYIAGATANVAPRSRVPAPSAQKIKRQLCLAEICPAVRQ